MELFKIGFVSIRLMDIIDISVVTFLFYKLYNLLRGSIAFRIVAAILAVFLFWKLVELMDLVLLKSILDPFLGVGALALIVLFATEIRRFLVIFAKNTFLDRLFQQLNVAGPIGADEDIKQILDAIEDIKKAELGALIVLTFRDQLERYQETGDKLDAEISGRLLASIFNSSAPLHDGAVIIADSRIAAARCILPISRNQSVPAELGLRHRSALGLSEVSHALVLIVSEERNEVSIAHEGTLHRNLDPISIESRIRDFYEKTPA